MEEDLTGTDIVMSRTSRVGGTYPGLIRAMIDFIADPIRGYLAEAAR